MSRKDIEKKVYSCASELLHEKGYVSPVDLLIKMDRLTKKQVEEWRFGKIPYLERVTIGNLSKLHHTLQTLEKFARKEELKSSKTVYMQWGKGAKRPLRFSKTGNPHMEGMYSTHYVKKQI